MRRSLLFIPGNNPAMLQNADIFGSDTIIIDLEDAVSITEKDSARNLVHYYLTSINKETFPSEITIRINGFDTPYYQDDLNLIVSDKIDSIMLPKAHQDDLIKLDQLLTKKEIELQMTKKIKIIPIIELATSVLEVERIAACPRVDGILLGAEDLSSDLEVERTKQGDEITYVRAKIACCCKAYKIDAIDTPFTDTTDQTGLIEDIKHAKTLGMNAKSAIHPNQISFINEMFMPSEKMIIWATRVLTKADEAKQKGLGVFSLDGKMVDKPVIERAEKIMKKVHEFEKRL